MIAVKEQPDFIFVTCSNGVLVVDVSDVGIIGADFKAIPPVIGIVSPEDIDLSITVDAFSIKIPGTPVVLSKHELVILSRIGSSKRSVPNRVFAQSISYFGGYSLTAHVDGIGSVAADFGVFPNLIKLIGSEENFGRVRLLGADTLEWPATDTHFELSDMLKVSLVSYWGMKL